MHCRFLFPLVLIFLCFSCSDEKSNLTTVDEEGNIILSPQSIELLEEISKDYYTCREEAAKKSDCKSFTSMAICKYYAIDDFKENGTYISYTKIKDIVRQFIGWELIGSAENQEVLKLAQKNANNHIATIAWDSSKDFGHIAIILPGPLKKSGAWGLECPNSASFFSYKAECYFNKPLSYSFSKPKNILIYAKK